MKTVCDSQVQELLNLIKPVVKHDTKQENYNIFKVLEVSRREVILCRFIADLLDPNGSHGLGITPLTIFVSEVLKRGDVTVDERYFQVETEYLIDNNRRIDIVIRDVKNNIVFPIEVKIDAKDQDAQLSDYYKY